MARGTSSYYPDHLTYPSLSPSPQSHQHYTQDVPTDPLQGMHDDQGHQSATTLTKHCSVRGCTAALPPDYNLKMCEACRGRHRVYATTKRAKRKMEKAALGGQGGHVVWMPPDAEDHSQSIPSSSQRQDISTSPEPQPQTPTHYSFHTTPWDSSAIDPRLFAQHSSSELAGALTLPPPPPPRRDPPALPPTSARMAMGAGDHYSGSYSSNQASSSRGHGGSTIATKGEISAQAISEVAAQLGDSSLPHRYCSIKGCKAVVPGNSFFKMCEPCRNRYRSYGTTKRAKWRREKEVAVAELQKMREEEDKRRAENGLPPLPEGDVDWRQLPQSSSPESNRSSFSQSVPTFAPRMCTVSHCREILPGDYEFLRCERHRIQNRHHSKLKRVRDKESKASAYEGWAATVNASSPQKSPRESETEDEFEEEDPDMYAKALPEGEPGTGVPPAARGSRRTNHVCCIKVCYNLLSPNNPWKMCDSCRLRDRTARRIKALRDSGVPVDPLPPRARSPPKSEGEKKSTKKKKGKKKAVDKGEEGERTTNEPRQDQPVGSSSVLQVKETQAAPLVIFMDPLVAEQTQSHIDTPPLGESPAELAFIHADETGNISEHPGVDATPVPSMNPPQPKTPKRPFLAPAPSPKAVPVVNKAPTPSTQVVTPTKSKERTQIAVPSTNVVHTPSTNPSTLTSVSSTPVPAFGAVPTTSLPTVPTPTTSTKPTPSTTVPTPATQPSVSNAPGHHQPQYHVPYFMSPFLAPYTSAPRYPYGTTAQLYPRDPYAPSPMYQPPYPSYSPYTYPPPGAYAHPYPPPPPLPATGAVAANSQSAKSSAAPTATTTAPTSTSISTPVSTPATVKRPPVLPRPTAVPPTRPPEAMYTTFSSRPGGAAGTNIHTNTTPYGASPGTPVRSTTETSPIKFTFSAKTGELCSRATGELRRKRVEEQGDDVSGSTSNKRVETGGDSQSKGGGNSSAARVSVTSQAPSSTSNEYSQGREGSTKICTSKHCHRSLPTSSPGLFCEKCRERMKKHQTKIKQRYRLEPKKLVAGSPSSR